MAMPEFFGKRKDHPLDQDLKNAREANANALDGLLGEIGALLGYSPADPARAAQPVPRRASGGRS